MADIFDIEYDDLAFMVATNKMVRDQIPYGIKLAVDMCAFNAKDQLVKDLPKHFTVRKPFTKNGMRVKRATKTKHEAEVGSLRPYMKLQAEGGTRKTKSKYVAVPVVGGARKTKQTAITKTNRIDTILNKKDKQARHTHFVLKLGTSRGVFTKTGGLKKRKRGFGKWGNSKVRHAAGKLTLKYWLDKNVKVKEQWPLFETTRKVVESKWEQNITKAINGALKTAR